MTNGLQKVLAAATLGVLIFTSSSTTMAAPVINDFQQSELQNLSAWPRIRDRIIDNLIGGSTSDDSDSYNSYNENYYNPPPPRPMPPPPPPPRPHRPHHPHHHYY